MDDDAWEDSLWTDATRTAFLAAAERAREALQTHVDLVATATSPTDEDRVEESGRAVRSVFAELSEAEFCFSATVSPFAELETIVEDEDADEDEDDIDAAAEHPQVSVLQRRDFAVTSEAAVLQAGRSAYLEAWPEDSAEAAAADITHLGRALYQIMHSGGVEALNDVPGLRPSAAVTLTVAPPELMTGATIDAVLDDPSTLFATGGEVLYSQSDIWS